MVFSYLSRTPGSYSHVQKVLEEAKPVSGSVEDNRRSCKPVKKVKPAAAVNDSSVAKILSNKGSKNGETCFQISISKFHNSNLLINKTLCFMS